MSIKIQRLTLITIGLLLVFIMFGACNSINQIQTAQAQTFEQHIPTFGLYCKDKTAIQAGTVKYDLSDAETVAQGKAKLQSNYQIVATNHAVEFAIPFISSIENTPSFSVTSNGQGINGSIWYGNTFLTLDKNTDIEALIDNTFSSEIDNNISGTLYTIIPDNETISIELSFAEGKKNSYIYDISNNLTSSNIANGICTWTLNNALIKSEYTFFILGEISDFSFSCSSEYQTETISCKEFIDSQYADLKELYDAFGVSIDFLYSMFNKIVYNNQSIKYDDFFLNSMYEQRFNTYRFSLNIDTDTVVSYESPISIQRNFAFTPTIYLVEQKNLGKYPISYSVELNNEMPYIIEASVNTKKNGNNYNAETAEDYYFVFCSSEKPESAMFPNNNDNNNTILIICCSITGSISFIVLVVLIGIAISKRVKRR